MFYRFIAGGIAGLASQFSIYPLETIKTRVMADIKQGKKIPSYTGSLTSPSPSIPSSVSSPANTTSSSSSLSLKSKKFKLFNLYQRSLLCRTAVEMYKMGGIKMFYRGLGPSLVGK